MEYQVVVYSTDAVFARMLELEIGACGMTVVISEHPDAAPSIAVRETPTRMPCEAYSDCMSEACPVSVTAGRPSRRLVRAARATISP